eukprot:7359448-Karenia_brevis.AAC.1
MEDIVCQALAPWSSSLAIVVIIIVLSIATTVIVMSMSSIVFIMFSIIYQVLAGEEITLKDGIHVHVSKAAAKAVQDAFLNSDAFLAKWQQQEAPVEQKRKLDASDYRKTGSVSKQTGGRWAIAETADRVSSGLELVRKDGVLVYLGEVLVDSHGRSVTLHDLQEPVHISFIPYTHVDCDLLHTPDRSCVNVSIFSTPSSVAYPYIDLSTSRSPF